MSKATTAHLTLSQKVRLHAFDLMAPEKAETPNERSIRCMKYEAAIKFLKG